MFGEPVAKRVGRVHDYLRVMRYLEEYRDVRRTLRSLVRELGISREVFNHREIENLDFKTVDTLIEIYAERVIEKLKEEKGIKT